MDDRYVIAEQNGMSREFADWFFDNQKDYFGNAWFVMMAAMWKGWEARAEEAPVLADVSSAIEYLKRKLVECNRYNYCAYAVNNVEDACRAAMLQSQGGGNTAAFKDGWISCSERMPEIGELNWRTGFPLLVTCEIGVIPAYYGFVSINGDKHYGFMESFKYGDGRSNHPQTNKYGLISNVTHWMPLPEPSRESKSE